MNEWEGRRAKARRRQVTKTRVGGDESSDELEDEVPSGRYRGDNGCVVCMPNVMRRERGRGGVSLTSHVHYENQLSNDELLDRLDGLRPGLKLTIRGRRRLKKCILAQAIFQIIKAVLIAWAYANHERVTHATMAACVFALIAIFSGHNALERQSAGWTKAYILFMAISSSLAAYPLYKQGGKGSGWTVYKRIPDSNRFGNIINAKYLEGIQDIGSKNLNFGCNQVI